MKKGFTLAEVLVTLGVIGVVAALTVPALVGQLPCENKIRFLKAHAALTSTIADLIVDPTLYYDDDPTRSGIVDPGTHCVGLSCQGHILNEDSNPLINDQVITDGTAPGEKLARLFASRMSRTNNSFSCANNQCSFSTSDGTTWTFDSSDEKYAIAKVTIDVNGAEGPDKSYDFEGGLADNEIIDRFEFYVDRDGGIEPVTDFESAVLANPSDLKRDEFKRLCHSDFVKYKDGASNQALRDPN